MALVTITPIKFGDAGRIELVFDDVDRLVRTVRVIVGDATYAICAIATDSTKLRLQRINRTVTGTQTFNLNVATRTRAGQIPVDPAADWPFALEAHLCTAADFATKFANL